ncbi:anti-repressor SinI family protein [Heyndrickxia sporothermodurans]|uniref:anti-repressor SinI family protein n=1 Tax=Heyndrickxia sporothermodurans TaxID=46224 RepID=UPI002DBEB9FC|nr:anti-repressor SinI family protein [Heyndrickxia sporothermodurans]MEB6548992.1 anti-repressor SinI family protein [Heyndrickxia sporothermodurans]
MKKLDDGWVDLIVEAKKLDLTIEEIRTFLNSGNEKRITTKAPKKAHIVNNNHDGVK